MIVMGLTVKVLATIAQERRAAADRQLGALEAGNLMERITAHPFDQVTPELARRMSVSDLARGSLRDCELAIDMSGGGKSATGMPSAKRVMIRLRWKGPGGQWQAPVRLTSWIEPGRTTPMIRQNRHGHAGAPRRGITMIETLILVTCVAIVLGLAARHDSGDAAAGCRQPGPAQLFDHASSGWRVSFAPMCTRARPPCWKARRGKAAPRRRP